MFCYRRKGSFGNVFELWKFYIFEDNFFCFDEYVGVFLSEIKFCFVLGYVIGNRRNV